MSETFAVTRSSFQRLKALLRDSDEDTRWMFGFWLSSFVLMGGAIIVEFGWCGAIFCFGLILWKAANSGASLT